MRESAWQITWDATGVSPRILVDYGDLLRDDISLAFARLYASAAADLATSSRHAARGNARHDLAFEVIRPHASPAAAWAACHTELALAPYGPAALKLLSIRGTSGAPVFYTAALRSSRHRPETSGGIAESAHRYEFALVPSSSGEAIVITRGWFNGTGGYVVYVPGGGWTPGQWVRVDDIPGLPDGIYQVGSAAAGAGGQAGNSWLTLDDAGDGSDDGDEAFAAAESYVESRQDNGAVRLATILDMHFVGVGDGAAYTYSINGGITWIPVTEIISGSKIVSRTVTMQNSWANWFSGFYGPPVEAMNPFSADGQQTIEWGPGELMTQTGGETFTLMLRRNGVLVDSVSQAAPRWAVNVFHNPSVTESIPTASANKRISMTVIGPGGGTTAPLGYTPEATGGTISTIEP